MLIPIALERVHDVLQEEAALAGHAQLAGPAPPPNKHMDAAQGPRYAYHDGCRDHKRPKARLGWGKAAAAERKRGGLLAKIAARRSRACYPT